MSIHDSEPEDNEWCTLHERYRPCQECRADEADRRHDTRKEQQP